MLKKLSKRILEEKLGRTTIMGWFAGFAGVVLIRMFLEVFSDPLPSGLIASKPQSLLAVFFFYLSIIFGLALIVSVFTKQKRGRVMTLLLYGLPVIWLAPIIDIVASGGRGFTMAYIFDANTKLLADFFMFFGPILNDGRGLTTGIHIELVIIMFGIGWYLWHKAQNIQTALVAFFLSYVLIFIMLALPGVIYTFTHLSFVNAVAGDSVSFIASAIQNSNIPLNTLHGSLLYTDSMSLLNFGFDVLFAQILYVITFILGLLWALYTYKEFTISVLRNARIERVLFYTSLLWLGMMLAKTLGHITFTWVDWVGVITIIISWFSAWMFAVHTNDIEDVDIDNISNPERPLSSKKLSLESMRETGYLWLAIALIGSYLAGYYVFYMSIMYISAYYIYSVSPLRLKRIPILSSFLVALACLSTFLAGFYFASPDKLVNAFPTFYAIGIVIVFTLLVNIRDIKDIEGDRAEGVQTLPVFFKSHGTQVVGGLVAFGTLLLPFFFPFFASYIVSVPFAIAGYWLCVRKQYNEKYLFALFFAYCLLSLLSVVIFM